MSNAPVLDACCGSRMFWFDKADDRAVFMDNRQLSEILVDGRVFDVSPDVVGDFTSMPFDDETFNIVVFDPPHFLKIGSSAWMAKKYGKLTDDWKTLLSRGFAECFRVLKPGGTLVFKWSTVDIPASEILKLTPHKPLFGNRKPKQSGTHWIVFMKEQS